MSVEKFKAVVEQYRLQEKRKFCVQIWQDGKPKVEYSGRDRKLTVADLEKHIAGKEFRTKGRRHSGAIAISLMPGTSAPVCLLCIDSDSAACTAALHAQLLPILRKNEIDYVWEFSGNERCHLWIAPFLQFPVAKALVSALFQVAGLNTNDYEVFPTKQGNKAVRLPGALHLKNGKINPVSHGDKLHESSDEIMQAMLDLIPVGEERATEIIQRIAPMVISEHKKKNAGEHRAFQYISRNLKTLAHNLPPYIKQAASNCNSINWIIDQSMNNRLLDERSGIGHEAGLVLARMALYSDAKESQRLGRVISTGKEWVVAFFHENRSREWEQHGWLEGIDAYKYVATCTHLKERFDQCSACPFQERIESPKQFYYDEIVPKPTAEKFRLVSHRNVREHLFPEFQKFILEKLDEVSEEW